MKLVCGLFLLKLLALLNTFVVAIFLLGCFVSICNFGGIGMLAATWDFIEGGIVEIGCFC